jgi:molybdopterin-binding protein
VVGVDARVENPLPGATTNPVDIVKLDHKEVPMKLSARNKLAGTVSGIHRGETIANVAIDVAGQRLVASITVEAVEELGLAEGSSVTAIIKASDVMLATDG